MNTLVIDIGGTNVKLWKTGESDKVKFPSGKSLTPEGLVDGARKAATGWAFDRVSMRVDSLVRRGYAKYLDPGQEKWSYTLLGALLFSPMANGQALRRTVISDASLQR